MILPLLFAFMYYRANAPYASIQECIEGYALGALLALAVGAVLAYFVSMLVLPLNMQWQDGVELFPYSRRLGLVYVGHLSLMLVPLLLSVFIASLPRATPPGYIDAPTAATLSRFPALTAAGCVAFLGLTWFFGGVPQPKYDAARCSGCGYPLQGALCPECGARQAAT